MKKRSLVASIAMLLVSAIVLSTSTYAWFSAGAAVSVEQITANVSHSDGSVLIRAKDCSSMEVDGQGKTSLGFTKAELDWGTTLKTDVINALFADNTETNYVKPENLIPITVDPGTAVAETTGQYTGSILNRSGTFSTEMFNDDGDATTPAKAVYKLVTGANGSGEGSYLKYQFDIKANADCEVTLTPTFNSGADFVFAAVKISDGNTYIFGNGARTYVPVKASQTIRDIDKDGIVESAAVASNGDYIAGAEAGDPAINDSVNALESKTVACISNTTNIVLDFDSEGVVTGNGGQKTITVYIWAEGQQEACTGACNPATANISFEAIKAA